MINYSLKNLSFSIDDMSSHKITLLIDGKEIETLADILPEADEQLKILFIGKVPIQKSVDKGHYFQGKQGTALWNRLKEYKLISYPESEDADDYLLAHKYGITDIAKTSRNFGSEPTIKEYEEGTIRILNLIKKHRPKIVFFVYKKVLEQILFHSSSNKIRVKYGFNHDCNFFENTKVFVYPANGLKDCPLVLIKKEMSALQSFIEEISDNHQD